jgi:hypothetical protein
MQIAQFWVEGGAINRAESFFARWLPRLHGAPATSSSSLLMHGHWRDSDDADDAEAAPAPALRRARQMFGKQLEEAASNVALPEAERAESALLLFDVLSGSLLAAYESNQMVRGGRGARRA